MVAMAALDEADQCAADALQVGDARVERAASASAYDFAKCELNEIPGCSTDLNRRDRRRLGMLYQPRYRLRIRAAANSHLMRP